MPWRLRLLRPELNLSTWDKPSIRACPCPADFPTEPEINLERLNKVAACELFMKVLHFPEFRVRYPAIWLATGYSRKPREMLSYKNSKRWVLTT
jgi:PP-loop superfamily ATP-utilizing enzyme